MALIVEDGTGITGAEAYASVATATAYWARFSLNPLAAVWSAPANAVNQEAALREGARFLDLNWGGLYPGQPLLLTQGLLWPRMADDTANINTPGDEVMYPTHGISRPWGTLREFNIVADLVETPEVTVIVASDGTELAPLPPQIVTANIELAARALQGTLVQPDFIPGNRLKVDQAGDHKFEFFDDADRKPTFGIVESLLAGVLLTGGQPGWTFR